MYKLLFIWVDEIIRQEAGENAGKNAVEATETIFKSHIFTIKWCSFFSLFECLGYNSNKEKMDV